jgi:hypothetical protein
MKKPRVPLRPIGLEQFTEGNLKDTLQWKYFKEKIFQDRWITDKYGGIAARMGEQIGGQIPMRGPDIIKFIKKHDPQNTGGSVKDALDIMQKLQDNSTKPNDLMSSIQPLQNILGGGLYKKMQAAGAATKSQGKVEEAVPENDIIAALIAAAIAMLSDEDAILVSELLDFNEVSLIRTAYYGNGVYVSANTEMPQTFINAINYLIPIFRATKGTV